MPHSAQSFGYDNLDRLTSYGIPPTTPPTPPLQTFTYDADGNRLTMVTGAGTATSTYPTTSNKLTSVAGLNAQSNTYDAMGNLTNDGTHSFTYDTRRRLWTSTTAGVTTTYRLNGLGQRTRKTDTGVVGGWRVYFYDNAGHQIGEYDNNGYPIHETSWLAIVQFNKSNNEEKQKIYLLVTGDMGEAH